MLIQTCSCGCKGCFPPGFGASGLAGGASKGRMQRGARVAVAVAVVDHDGNQPVSDAALEQKGARLAEVCPECGIAKGTPVRAGRTRWAWIVPSIAVVAVLIVGAVYTVQTRLSSPVGSGYWGYPPMARGTSDKTIGEIAKDSRSGDEWVRLLLTSPQEWRLFPAMASVQVARVSEGPVPTGYAVYRGWPMRWLEMNCTIQPTGLKPGSAVLWSWRVEPSGVRWTRSTADWQTQYFVSFASLLATGGLFLVLVLILRWLSVLMQVRRVFKILSTVLLTALIIGGAMYESRTLPMFFGTWVPTTVGMNMAEVSALKGLADADAKLAQALIESEVDGALKARQIGLNVGREPWHRLHVWATGWPFTVVSKKRLWHPDDGPAGAVILRDPSLQVTLWLPKRAAERYQHGHTVHVGAWLALGFACWLAYKATWLVCHGFERWRSRRWVRRGFCGGCGYDLR